MGAHGWVAGIASHGSVSLSRGWLISVEAPRHPGHLSSIHLDAVVKLSILDSYIMYKESTRSPVLQRVFRRELFKELLCSSGISPRSKRPSEEVSRMLNPTPSWKPFPRKNSGYWEEDQQHKVTHCLFSCPKEDFGKSGREEEEAREGV